MFAKLCLTVALLGVAVCAFAGRKDTEYAEAVRLIKQRKYSVARTLLSAVAREERSPRVFYALGYCQEKTGAKEDASKSYRRAVAYNVETSEDGDDTKRALKRLVQLEPELGSVLDAARELEAEAKREKSPFLRQAAMLLYKHALGGSSRDLHGQATTGHTASHRDTGASAGTRPTVLPVPSTGGVVGEDDDDEDEPELTREDRQDALGYRLGWHKHGAKKFGDHYYMLVDDEMSCEEARRRCHRYGGYLVTLNSRAEESFVRNLLSYAQESGDDYYYYSRTYYHRIWLGASNEKNRDWSRWMTGERMSYEGSGYDSLPQADAGDNPYRLYYSDGRWRATRSEQTKHRFVCEWEK